MFSCPHKTRNTISHTSSSNFSYNSLVSQMLTLTDVVSPIMDTLTRTTLPVESAPILPELDLDWSGDDLVDDDGWVKFDTYSVSKMDEFGKIEEFVGLGLEELKRLEGREWVLLPTAKGFRKSFGYIFIGEDSYDNLSDFA